MPVTEGEFVGMCQRASSSENNMIHVRYRSGEEDAFLSREIGAVSRKGFQVQDGQLGSFVRFEDLAEVTVS